MFTSRRQDIADNIQPDIISSTIDVKTAKRLARHVKQRYEWHAKSGRGRKERNGKIVREERGRNG